MEGGQGVSVRSLLLGLVAMWSCSDVLPIDRAARIVHRFEAETDRVVLVVLDGVRWQDVFDGAADMPTLHRWMREEGTCIGAPGYGEMRATGPNYVSLPSYREIFSGRGPQACQDNECARTTEPTLVDELVRAGQDAVVVSSWESIEHAASVGDVPMSAGRLRLHRAEGFDAVALAEGRAADPWPGIGEYRPDVLTARLAESVLRAKPPTFLFVGLGEPDEYAHRGDREGYLASLHAADRILETLERATDDSTTFLVTADHGRCVSFRDHGGGCPESGRVWLVAKGGTVPRNGFVPSSRHRLADIAPTIRVLLGLTEDGHPLAGRPIAELLP
jgi:predicted AlkP superfamily pyrophosphatase or phosphodiesterase